MHNLWRVKDLSLSQLIELRCKALAIQPVILHKATSAYFSRNLLLPPWLRGRLEFPEARVSAVRVGPSALQGAQAKGVREGGTSQGYTKEGEKEGKENDRIRTN